MSREGGEVMSIWSRLFELLRRRPMVTREMAAEGAACAIQFAKRVAMLTEMTEEQQITNLDKYLKTTAQVINQLRAANAPDAVLQRFIVELQVPAAMAQRNALMAIRAVSLLPEEPKANEADNV